MIAKDTLSHIVTYCHIDTLSYCHIELWMKT